MRFNSSTAFGGNTILANSSFVISRGCFGSDFFRRSLIGRLQMARQPKPVMNLMELIEQFDSDSKCRTALEFLRWPEGPQCPRCESERAVKLPDDRGVFDCYSCGYQFTVTSGTVLHDTHLPLRKWFVAAYLMCESRKGISANQMKRTISVSYKTAWYLCHPIRAAMKEADPEPLTGTVEVDETFVGGKAKFMHRVDRARRIHGRGGIDKTMVLGAIQRDGAVRFRVETRR